MKESAVTSHVRLLAAQLGVELWRNNCGGFYDDSGRFVRYGLGSFTPQQNCASSDFIGIRRVLITPDMVGQVVGVFTAVEMKSNGWKYRPNDKHSSDQKHFIDIVLRAGGMAGFATNVEDFKKIIKVA
jgi:hypothetical protein